MKKKTFLLLIILLTIVAIPVFAKTKDNFYANEDVTLDNATESTTFVAGNNVELSSEIDGASFVAGNNLKITSSQDYIFAAGNNINLEGITTKDAFIAGNIINIQQSNIRDLYAAGSNIRIDSDISRNAYLAGDQVIINAKIDGDVTIASEKIRIGKEASITGTLKYPEGVDVSIANPENIGKTKTYKESADVKIEINPISRITATLYSFLSMLVVALAFYATNKKFFKKLEKEEKNGMQVLKAGIIGLATLILLPIVAIIVMITVIGIPISIISLLIYGLLIYLSVIPTAYYFGKWIAKDSIKNNCLLLFLSLLIVYVVRLLPVIGGLVSFLSLCIGLGLYMILIKKYITEKK